MNIFRLFISTTGQCIQSCSQWLPEQPELKGRGGRQAISSGRSWNDAIFTRIDSSAFDESEADVLSNGQPLKEGWQHSFTSKQAYNQKTDWGRGKCWRPISICISLYMHCNSETPKKCTGNLIEVEIVGNSRKVIRGNSSGSKGLTLKTASPLFPHVHFHLQLRFPFHSNAFLVRIREKTLLPVLWEAKQQTAALI